MLRHRSLVQHVSPCDGEELVVDVHAVLFWLGCVSGLGTSAGGALSAYLVAWILVDASPVAVVVAAVFQVIAVVSRHGQSAGTVSGLLAVAHDARCYSAGANAGPTVARSGEEQCTHPFDAIVTIGTMLSSRQAS